MRFENRVFSMKIRRKDQGTPFETRDSSLDIIKIRNFQNSKVEIQGNRSADALQLEFKKHSAAN